MDKFDRIQQLHRELSTRRRPVTKKQLAEILECTEKTAQRSLDNLRDYLQAPLIYDAEAKGWCYQQDPNTPKFELPGLWLTSEEIEGLATLLTLVKAMGSNDLGVNFTVIEKQIQKLLAVRGIDSQTFLVYIKYLPVNKHRHNTNMLSKVADALHQKKRLYIQYIDYSGQKTQREVSPQTLVNYAENWYLDAWCHLRNDLRQFMLARMERVEPINTEAESVERQQLDAYFASAYGIFAGKAKRTAKIRFSPQVAREVASRQWHPEQELLWQGKEVVLSIPYGDDRELIRDILKYGINAEVLAPAKLREKLAKVVRGMGELYV